MLLRVQEVAERLRVDQTTIRRWCQQGTLAYIELPRTGPKRKFRIHDTEIKRLYQEATERYRK